MSVDVSEWSYISLQEANHMFMRTIVGVEVTMTGMTLTLDNGLVVYILNGYDELFIDVRTREGHRV